MPGESADTTSADSLGANGWLSTKRIQVHETSHTTYALQEGCCNSTNDVASSLKATRTRAISRVLSISRLASTLAHAPSINLQRDVFE
jgi:hypothetical protein